MAGLSQERALRGATQRGQKRSHFASVSNLARRVYREYSEDRIPAVAGGITFFILLAIFPAIASVVSVYGIFAHRSTIERDIDLISGFLPGGAVSVLRTELHRLISQKSSALNFTFLFSSIIALWSASGGFSALIDGLNIAYEARETRSFIRLTLNALLFTVIAVLLCVIAISLGLIIPSVTDRAPISHALTVFLQLLMWPISFYMCAIVVSVVYRYGPDRPNARFQAISWGSAIASALWLLGTRLFSLYVQYFGSYDRVYGNLGAVVGFLTWVWISLVILLLGAEINCELNRSPSRKS